MGYVYLFKAIIKVLVATSAGTRVHAAKVFRFN